ncbi:hypothetical protein D3C74_469200 [compost metagenome]
MKLNSSLHIMQSNSIGSCTCTGLFFHEVLHRMLIHTHAIIADFNDNFIHSQLNPNGDDSVFL